MGRPRKPLDRESLRMLCGLGATEAEMARILEVSGRTIARYRSDAEMQAATAAGRERRREREDGPKRRKRDGRLKKRKAGRPKIVIDSREVKMLASLLLPEKLIAATLGISRRTLARRLEREYREAWEGGHTAGCTALRQWQHEAARKGDGQLLDWLGAQALEQRRAALESTPPWDGSDNRPAPRAKRSQLNRGERARLRVLLRQASVQPEVSHTVPARKAEDLRTSVAGKRPGGDSVGDYGLRPDWLGAPIASDLARRHLHEFVRQAWHIPEPAREFIDNWHIAALCYHLEAVRDGQIRQLLISLPPGHMKSLVTSIFWPAWMWIERPEWRVLTCSYSLGLATDHARQSRAILGSEWYQRSFSPQWTFVKGQNRKQDFANTRRGARTALTVEGAATGHRADAIVADDPLNAREQCNVKQLEKVIFWWEQVMSSRLNDPRKGAKIIIMQRLHERDLTGYCLAQGGYEHLCLPSEFEPRRRCVTGVEWRPHPRAERRPFADPRTEAGELLFPARFPREVIEEQKRNLGAYGYSAQHQQRPSSPEGGILQRRWLRFWQRAGARLEPLRMRLVDGAWLELPLMDLPESWDGMCQSWECGFDRVEHSDGAAGQVWARKGSMRFLLDQYVSGNALAGMVKAMRGLSERYPEAYLKLVGTRANGPSVIRALQMEIGGVLGVDTGEEISRAWSTSTFLEAGNVYLPHPGEQPWAGDFVEQCMAYPVGEHADQVNAMTQALLYWNVPTPGILFFDDDQV